MGWKNDLYENTQNAIINSIYKFEINLYFRRYIQLLKKKSRHDYTLSSDMKRDYISYYKSFGYKNVHTDWLEYIYGITGKYDRRYVPDDIFNKYIDYPYTVNRVAWQNKANQPKILDGVKYSETIVKNINGILLDGNDKHISIDQALSIIREYDEVVIKPVIGGAGRDIQFCCGEYADQEIFANKKDFIVQKCIEQSDYLKLFNDSAVNVLKITSFMFHGEVHILSSRIWVSRPGERISNRITCAIPVDASGRLQSFGYDLNGNKYFENSNGKSFPTGKVDFYDECIDIIKYGHKKLLYFPFISWDFTQDSNGNTILIEYNLKWHVLYDIQLLSGPAFGDITDDVLRESSANIHKNVPIVF